jgi:hypothetical protein
VANLASLQEIPFLDRYRRREAQIREEVMDDLRAVGSLAQLQAQMQGAQEKRAAAAREAQYRADVQGLGPNPTQEQLATVGARYASPDKLMDVQTRSLDRQSQTDATREAAAGRLQQQRDAMLSGLEQKANSEKLLHEFRMTRLQTDKDRAAETARHNAALEEFKGVQVKLDEQFRRMGLGIQQQNADTQRGMLELRRDTADKTSTGGGKAPSGYRFKADGVTLEPIPGGPATVQSPEAAAKTELLANGIKDVDRFRELVLKDNKINRKLIAGMAVPGGGVPGTDSRLAYSYIYNAIEAKLRAESGAAVPETEVHRMAKRFVPSALDNDATVTSKVDRLAEFLGGSLGRVKGQPGAGTNNTTPSSALPSTSDIDAELARRRGSR